MYKQTSFLITAAILVAAIVRGDFPGCCSCWKKRTEPYVTP